MTTTLEGFRLTVDSTEVFLQSRPLLIAGAKSSGGCGAVSLDANGALKTVPGLPGTTATGTSKFRSVTVDSTAQAVKASAGNLYGINIANPHSAAIYVKLYDKAAASVNPASDVPVLTLMVPATSPYTLRGLDLPVSFATAIAVRAVTNAGDTGTTAPATLPIIELEYK